MSLHLHRAERADQLADALAGVLRTPLADPFVPEIVSVPTPGVERWLAQRLSGHLGTRPGAADGVCAGVQFPTLGRLIGRATDPWQPRRAVWPLLRVIDAGRGEAWAEPLWGYLGDRPGGRRWPTARHLAILFATYASARPAMLDAWRQGRDVDGTGRALPPDRAWQAELWRRLLADIGDPPSATSADGPGVGSDDLAALPSRLSVFGITRLEGSQVRALTALAVDREIHLWLPHPSPILWDRLRTELTTGGSAADPRRAADRTETCVRHPLLRYLGRDVRELQHLLAAAGTAGSDEHHGPTMADVGAEPTLLRRLQRDIAVDQPPRVVAERPVLARTDRSVTLHASHGPDRQVEVLRELLVGMLADDPTLEPRDIVVMCPDIETFAPLIAAAFGLDDESGQAEHPGHRLRVRLADRSLRQLNPLLGVLAAVLELADSRMPASALLDLCATPPVAARFGFHPDDIARVQELVAASGVRWGLDASHRERFGMGGFAQNTWAAGLDRLLLGIAMDEGDQHFLGTALPLDEVDSSDVELVGRLAEFLRRLRAVVDGCARAHPVSGWVTLLRGALEELTAAPPAETWQQTQAFGELARLAEDAAADDVELALPEVAALLREAFRGRPGRANFRTGTLTVATLLPMRSVPHRVVCLLGVDDGVFPRRTRPDGDDITAVDPWVGDPDPRAEDRQLLLDAVLAAEDRLVVIYAGSDPRTGVALPPAVPVGALLDALDGAARTEGGAPVRELITVRHPLQPFDGRNFQAGALGTPAAFSFDRGAWRGVQATRGHRHEPQVFGSAQLAPTVPAPIVELLELTRFYAHPVRALLRERAGLSFWRDEEGPAEQLPAQLDGLERWAIGERLLRLRLQGHGMEALSAAEWRRGDLPPRRFGAQALEAIAQEVEELATAASAFLVGPANRHEVAVELPPPAAPRGAVATTVVGTVADVHGPDLVRVTFSRISARHRLLAWLELLALSAENPAHPWRAVVVGRGGSCVLGPVEGAWAARSLADLVDLRRTGLNGALPFAPKTSAEYAWVRRRWPDRPVATIWSPLAKLWNDERDASYAQFFPAAEGLDALLAEPSRPSEVLGALAEPTRFGTLARRVFEPLYWIEAQS